ncbi:MAG TPA: phosphoribosyltransferase, partial [Spirochaetia bacterium]|nr:phosphoribosyltransferase [Spirochaetia bacterium]
MSTPSVETQDISLDEMMNRIKQTVYGPFDLVVAVERGGILPAYLAARHLDVQFATVALRFRDESHAKLYSEPQVVHGLDRDVAGLR